MRRQESDETAESTCGERGEKQTLYVQEPTGSVTRDASRVGDQSFTVPSQDDEANTSLDVGDQATEKTSRLCSVNDMTGKEYEDRGAVPPGGGGGGGAPGTLAVSPMSNSLIDPSPVATRSCLSFISDHARS